MKRSQRPERRSCDGVRAVAALPRGLVLLLLAPRSAASRASAAQRAWTAAQPATHLADEAPASNHPPVAEIYRPFASRFEERPGNGSRASERQPQLENRQGYRAYLRDNPRHPQSPTSLDRNAESTAVCVFVVAAVVFVPAVLIAFDRAQHHPLEKQAPLIFAACAVPWLIASAFTLRVALRHFGGAWRGELDDEQGWECDGLVWYLLLMPPLTAIAAVSKLVALLPDCVPESPNVVKVQVPMGRMFDSDFAYSAFSARERFLAFVQPCGQPSMRLTFVVMVAVVALFGAGLVAFTPGGRDRCQPELWWTSAVLASVTILVVLFIALPALGSLLVERVAGWRWLQDFVGSFQREQQLVADPSVVPKYGMDAIIRSSSESRPKGVEYSVAADEVRAGMGSVQERYDARMAALTNMRHNAAADAAPPRRQVY